MPPQTTKYRAVIDYMDIQEEVSSAIQQAVTALYQQEIGDVVLQPTKKEFAGTYTFVTFPLTKALRQPPAQIGQAIGTWLVENTNVVSAFNVVQGFLNISITDAAWLKVLTDIAANPAFGTWLSQSRDGEPKSVMVEFSSPNTNKPLHLGHLRNIFLGDSVSRILTANGYNVAKTCIVNDRGVHICKSMLAYQLFGDGETPESSGMKGDHLIGKYYVLFDKAYKAQVEEMVAAGTDKETAEKTAPLMQTVQQMLRLWEQSDPETLALWNKLNTWVYAGFDVTYRTIGVTFDKIYYESQTYLLGKEIIEAGLQKGVFYRKDDNSVWIDLTEEGLDQKLVLRADGTSVYITQDLGTTELKYRNFGADRQIWVVGNEQDYHFNVLFAILRRLGRPYAGELFHLSYGMVDLPTGKMKSREGTVVDADDLIQETIDAASAAADDAAKGKLDEFSETEKNQLFQMLGLGALKYYLLKVDPQKRMQFNPAESVDLHGNTGPYIQYVHARIKSVLRKAAEMDLVIDGPVAATELDDVEQQLIFLLSQFPLRVKEAGEDLAPSYLAQYAYEMAKTFNQFYDKLSILKETDTDKLCNRLVLSKAVAETIRKAMELLGIDVPEKM
ncbi:MAG TPA: arginine--tRNA ligase [Spirosoma sp.]|nr:arginine--tRNA ligase [Spirosoma sp.]